MPKESSVIAAFELARDRYSEVGVDVEAALTKLKALSISIHCWQGDDVGGFESAGTDLGGGLAVTGNYPGKARTPSELRDDLVVALKLIPGNHRVNLHAFYGEFEGEKVDRNQISTSHFENWKNWAKSKGLGIDFNPTCFAHPLASDGWTLSSPDRSVREFWIEHCKRSREIGSWFSQELGSPSVTNVWIPDGAKEIPADRLAPRQRLQDSLDEVFKKELSPTHFDAVESKLFGIGSESYVVGSFEFYLGYASSRKKVLCLDMGHFHPTEGIADKMATCLMWVPRLLLHVSRGVRWDSDHVVLLSEELQAVTNELVRSNLTDRTHLGLDYFDASINRIAAWVVGTRNFQKALLISLLEPTRVLRDLELDGDLTAKMVLSEEAKTLPFGAVWDMFCLREEVPIGETWIEEVREYESRVLNSRV